MENGLQEKRMFAYGGGGGWNPKKKYLRRNKKSNGRPYYRRRAVHPVDFKDSKSLCQHRLIQPVLQEDCPNLYSVLLNEILISQAGK